MKLNHLIPLLCAAALLCAQTFAQGAKTTYGELFPDKVVAKGKGVEVKASQVEEAYLAFKANRAATGREIPDSQRKLIEEQIIDRLLATQLFINQASEADKKEGAATAEKFIAELKKRAPSEAAFERQLRAEGVTPEQFERQVREQGIVKAVIDREIKAKQNITPEQIKKFYDANPDKFKDPEAYRVTHILMASKDQSGRELPTDVKTEKRAKLEKILQEARDGKNWEALVRANSEDAPTRDKGGEYTFVRGQMPLEFEAAAVSLQPGQVSDIVTTRYGFHIIKLVEKIPAKTVELAKVEDKIRDALLQDAVQKELPTVVERLKKEANVEVLGM